MIVVDTNVVSEPLKPNGSQAVLDWLDRQVADTLYLTATSLSELLVGVDSLPQGQRKDGLKSELNGLLARLFSGRILPFDQIAAIRYAEIVARARRSGRAIGVTDGQIAAIASIPGFAVATRDVAPFISAGVKVINPWEL